VCGDGGGRKKYGERVRLEKKELIIMEVKT